MPLHRVQVIIPADSASPADSCVNNFGIDVMGSWAASEAAVVAALKAFYDTWNTMRAPTMDWGQTRLKAYDMTHAKPRAPVADVLLGLATGTGSGALPHEVALCVSFQRLRASGVNMRRGRGRVYLGPLAEVSNNGLTGRPSTTCTTAIRNAAQGLLDASRTSVDWEWNIISEAGGTPTGHPVHNGWVDNAYDTQRRRGQETTSRVVFTPVA